MSWNNTTQKYGWLSIALHWLTFFLLIAVYASMELREFFERGSDLREGLKSWHYTLGLCVFVITLIRLVTRWCGATPQISPKPPVWQKPLVSLMHLALYLFMIIMPLLGWALLSAEGKDISFFGINLPALINSDKQQAEWLEELHENIGIAGYFLIAMHTLAALFHHYFLRDNALKLMLPSKNKSHTQL